MINVHICFLIIRTKQVATHTRWGTAYHELFLYGAGDPIAHRGTLPDTDYKEDSSNEK
jgi:hypothetical protein